MGCLLWDGWDFDLRGRLRLLAGGLDGVYD